MIKTFNMIKIVLKIKINVLSHINITNISKVLSPTLLNFKFFILKITIKHSKSLTLLKVKVF